MKDILTNISLAKLFGFLPDSIVQKIERVLADSRKIKALEIFETDIESTRRPASFPFVSGDTFRALANFQISKNSSVDEVKNFRLINSEEIVFCDLPFIFQNGAVEALNLWLRESSKVKALSKTLLILHNGDIPPSKEILDELVHEGWFIACVNLLHEDEGLTPLPIGIENLHWGINGNLEEFTMFRRNRSFRLDHLPRERILFSSFNISTNEPERSRLANLVAESRHKQNISHLSPKEFREELFHSKFVLSPPGNGLDCHRTWEAIYAGAIPVVKKGTLSEIFIEQLPILEVEDWESFLSLSDEQLSEIYETLIKRPTFAAEMPYWIAKFAYVQKEKIN